MMRYFFVVFFLTMAVGLIWLFFGPAIRSWGKRFSSGLEDNWDAVEEANDEERDRDTAERRLQGEGDEDGSV